MPEEPEIEKLLKSLCPGATLDKDGNVTVDESLVGSKCAKGCECLKELVNNSFSNLIQAASPRDPIGTTPDDKVDSTWQVEPYKKDPGVSGKGSRATTAFDPSRRSEERKKVGDPWKPVEQYIILGHELCGHMLELNRGRGYVPIGHTVDPTDKSFVPQEEKNAEDVENQLRREHGIDNRPRPFGDPSTQRTLPN